MADTAKGAAKTPARPDGAKLSAELPPHVAPWMLRTLGLGILVAAAAFLFESFADKKIDGGVVTLLIAGIAVIFAAELLPVLANLKVSTTGIELNFKAASEDLSQDIASLNARVGQLEVAARRSDGPAGPASADPSGPRKAKAGQGALAKAAAKPPPAELLEPGSHDDDQRKGQFGDEPERSGFRLRATFPGAREDRDWTRLHLVVEAVDRDADTSDVRSVEFFLHQSFRPSRIPAPFQNGRAQLDLTIWGGFTVGVWIGAREVKLELDLAEMPNAPRIVREL